MAPHRVRVPGLLHAGLLLFREFERLLVARLALGHPLGLRREPGRQGTGHGPARAGGEDRGVVAQSGAVADPDPRFGDIGARPAQRRVNLLAPPGVERQALTPQIQPVLIVDHDLHTIAQDGLDSLDHRGRGRSTWRRPWAQHLPVAFSCPRRQTGFSQPPHRIGLVFQPRVIVHRQPAADPQRRLDPALRLLDQVPGLVRQQVLLARRDMNLAAHRIGQRIELRGTRRVAVDLDMVQ